MIKWPTKLAGQSAITRWLNSLLAAIKSGALVEGPGYRLKTSSSGTRLDLDAVKAGGGANNDFILCRNGEQIRVKLLSSADPTTVEPDTGEEDPAP